MTQEQALAILKSGKNVFITGPAGSGKTFILSRYIEWLAQAGDYSGGNRVDGNRRHAFERDYNPFMDRHGGARGLFGE